MCLAACSSQPELSSVDTVGIASLYLSPHVPAHSTGAFCLWLTLTAGINIELIPPHAVVNGSILLHVTQIRGSVRSFSWFKGEHTRSQNQILSYNIRHNPVESPGPLYSPRFTCFPNASLKISDLNSEDQCDYTVQVTTDTQMRSSVQLHVHGTVTRPLIRSSLIYPIVNEELRLTCDTLNAEKIRWGRSGKSFPPGVIRSSDNSSITFPGIRLQDAGGFWCEAENPVSKATSDLHTLHVYCLCGSAPDLSAGDISGIVIGTLLGLILLVGGIFLLLFFRRHKWHKKREEPREEANEKPEVGIDYYNMEATTAPDRPEQEPAYMDLQFSSPDMYSDLQK